MSSLKLKALKVLERNGGSRMDSAVSLQTAAERVGFRFHVQDGRVFWQCPKPVPEDLLEALKEYKLELLALVQIDQVERAFEELKALASAYPARPFKTTLH